MHVIASAEWRQAGALTAELPQVMHCLKNSRVSHMIMRDSEEPHSHGGCCSDGHDHAGEQQCTES